MGQFSKDQKIQRSVHQNNLQHNSAPTTYRSSNPYTLIKSLTQTVLTKGQQARKDERDKNIANRKLTDFLARKKENKENNMTPAPRPFRAPRCV